MHHVERFLARLQVVGRTPAGWMACCPCPDHGGDDKGDSNPSLGIGLGEGGKILVHCFAGCKLDAILEAVGMAYTDLWPAKDGRDEPADGVVTIPPDRTSSGEGVAAVDPDLCHRVYSS